MTPPDWSHEAATALNAPIIDIAPLSGGCVGEVYRLYLKDGRRVVAKVSRSIATQQSLGVEAYMLSYLAIHSNLPVPRVLHSGEQVLLLGYMEGESHFTPAAQYSAAEMLAALHQNTAVSFGLERDTLIGGLHQPNPWTDSWIEFFAEQRLRAMAQQAVDAGRLPGSVLARVADFAAHLDRWLEGPGRPALLHGDVWTTNVLATADRVTAFLDPAIYYGHPEVELAFITLFQTFAEPFFERYTSICPIRPGFFEERRDIYNLYPLLVHVRLFGGGYLASVQRTLDHFGY